MQQPDINRILVCGGRDFNDKRAVYNALDRLCEERGWQTPKDEYGNWLPANVTIIHGGATGADALADDWAIVNWVPQMSFPADWRKHGNSAGPIRNQQMIDEGQPTLVVAFPGGRGTEDMKRRAKKAGIPIVEPIDVGAETR